MKTATKEELGDSGISLNVMMIEDSTSIVERVKGMIDGIAGIRFVGSSDDATDAFHRISEEKPDIAIMDIHLKSSDGKNGIYLLSQVRKICPDMKIIMLTNLADLRYRKLCMEFGANYFFDKSNDFDKIPDTLRRIVLEHRGVSD